MRTVPSHQIHLTLLFIGDTDSRELAETTESVRRACAGTEPFELTARRLVTLPPEGEPRVLAIETDAPPVLLEIQRRLVSRLARPSQRTRGAAFLPHLTVGRFEHVGTHGQIERDIEPVSVLIKEIRLMESVLRPTGAEHTVVERIVLGGD